MSTQSAVAGTLHPWISLLSDKIRRAPSDDIYDILARPEVSNYLDRQLFLARNLAEARLRAAWPATTLSPYWASLESDIARAYAEAATDLRQAAVIAFQHGGADRVAEVRRQVSAVAWRLGMRNELTVAVARTRRAGENVLSSVLHSKEPWLKKWVTRQDRKVCEWCRLLASQPAIPVHEEFSFGSVTGRRPPRVYRDLQCPPAHPRCRCRIILVRPGSAEAEATPPARGARYISASYVRGMKEDRYRALHDFHSAAMHELGQVLRGYQEAGNT